MTNDHWDIIRNAPAILDYRLINEATDCADPERLDTLSRNPDANVRARVAENARTPVDVLERLATETGPEGDLIQGYLVRNPAVPYRVLKQLVNIPSEPLRKRILKRLLEAYETARVDLTGEEVQSLLTELVPPDTGQLELIEVLETIHEKHDIAKTKKI